MNGSQNLNPLDSVGKNRFQSLIKPDQILEGSPKVT